MATTPELLDGHVTQELAYSILAQQELLRSYGAQLNVTIESFSDVETAKIVERPGFNEMVSYLRKHPDCRSLLVEKRDRLYRNSRTTLRSTIWT
jgi:DNA invertase Pin-like site-specific DNA recombinase